jgi:hypothetical protein
VSYAQTHPPQNILVSSTYDGTCVRISWDAPSRTDGISWFNIYESSTELSCPALVGSISIPGLTFYYTPSLTSSPFSGGGRFQDSHWWYRVSTVSCYGESPTSSPVSAVNEMSLDNVYTFEGTSWAEIL